jgi:hypothetical protein
VVVVYVSIGDSESLSEDSLVPLLYFSFFACSFFSSSPLLSSSSVFSSSGTSLITLCFMKESLFIGTLPFTYGFTLTICIFFSLSISYKNVDSSNCLAVGLCICLLRQSKMKFLISSSSILSSACGLIPWMTLLYIWAGF